MREEGGRDQRAHFELNNTCFPFSFPQPVSDSAIALDLISNNYEVSAPTPLPLPARTNSTHPQKPFLPLTTLFPPHRPLHPQSPPLTTIDPNSISSLVFTPPTQWPPFPGPTELSLRRSTRGGISPEASGNSLSISLNPWSTGLRSRRKQS